VTIRYGAHGPDGAEPVVSDGPFTESAEVIGGLYVLEVADLDEAIELARHIPAAEGVNLHGGAVNGAIELRPLVEWGQEPAPEGLGRYLALLAGPESEADQPGTAAWDEAVAAHGRFAERAGDAVLGGGALHPSSTATTIRVRDGDLQVTDGPFTEATEIIGGLYLLAAASRDEAVALARDIPMGERGLVELRPVVEFDD
jgi:hypothetical protein